MTPDTKFKFGEWLPDLPDLDNPGITEAKNVLRISGSYQPYLPLATVGNAVSGVVWGALRARGLGTSGTFGNVYVGSSDGVNSFLNVGASGVGGTWTLVTPAAYSLSSLFSFVQFNETVIVANGVDKPQMHALGSLSAFSKLTGANGDAPIAVCVGIIGQFVMLGNLFGTANYAVQWSGIGDPTNWPTPNSALAVAAQSGIQFLDPALGSAEGFSRGDQWGVIFQEGGLTRTTYTGGGTVFQFDTIYRGPGPLSQAAFVKVGGAVYFVSTAGFFVTDGTQALPIGRGKVDQYFLSRVDPNNLHSVQCGVDFVNRLIYWTLPKVGDAGLPQELLAYNYEEQKWTHVFNTIHAFVGGDETVQQAFGAQAFGNNSKIGSFTGTAGTAVITSPEMELNPGKRALVRSFTPQITGSTAVTVRVGSRNLPSDAVTFTSAITPDPNTGDANCLVDNRYHRAETTIVGNFTQAIGGEFDAQPTSAY